MDSNPSSSTAGFFQVPPRVENQYFEDAALQRIITFYLPSTVRSAIEPDLSRFGQEVLRSKVLDWVADAEKNPPFLRTWDTWGRRRDELVTSAGWRNLQDMGIAEGIVAIAYERKLAEHSRLYQFIKYHLWTGSCATVTCPSAMTDGAARLLSKQISQVAIPSGTRRVLEAAYNRLVSRNPAEAWTSGQWMTERAGGSDVSGTETQAIYAPSSLSTSNSKGVDGAEIGPWLLSGFKWFSSATDSSMTVLLARTPKGVSAFYAPMRRTVSSTEGTAKETELNGVTIQRLKSKLGTRPLPTAELELKGMRAYLLGEEGQGIKEIATVLNITRVHNAVTTVGLWGRGLAISRAFARVRKAGGKPLAEVPAHVRTMATQHVDYRANMHLTFFTVALLGLSEQPTASRSSVVRNSIMPSSQENVQLLLRVLTPVTKALTAKAAIAGLAECMESLGGVGYLENEDMAFNIARLFRDANVLSIWEGTTDVMADDMVKVLKGRSGGRVLAVLSDWVAMTASSSGGKESKMQDEKSKIGDAWTKWRRDVDISTAEELQVRGRDVMKRLGWIVCAALLVADACRDDETATREIARRWIQSISPAQGSGGCWQDAVELDKVIVFASEIRGLARL